MRANAKTVQSITPDLALNGIAERLRIAREHAGLSQEQFANKMECGRRRVVAWENGENAPPVLIIARIREVCGVDPEWVLSGPGLVPLVDVTEEDRDRDKRVKNRIRTIARGYGLELSADAVRDMARVVLREPPEHEDAALDIIRASLRAIPLRRG